ncbi:hypothetical protein EJB05_44612, partial [Eragrostis curvula]
MPDDGRLCVGALENEVLWLCVQGKGSGDGWVLEEKICMNKVLDLVPGLPKHPMGRTYTTMLDDIDAGRTGKGLSRARPGISRASTTRICSRWIRRSNGCPIFFNLQLRAVLPPPPHLSPPDNRPSTTSRPAVVVHARPRPSLAQPPSPAARSGGVPAASASAVSPATTAGPACIPFF